MVDVSISVVVYRDYDTPLKMIESLDASLGDPASVHVYVIDNSDLEQLASLCGRREAFVEECSRFRYVEYLDAKGNLGFGKANNLALRRSQAAYHAFVNPDILFIDDAIGKLKRFMDERPSTGMCIPRIVGPDGAEQCSCRREVTVLDAFNRMVLKGALRGRERWHTMADQDRSEPFPVPFGQGSFLFGRTELLKSLGGFDESFFMYLEDADLCKRLNEVSTLEYCPYATVVHKWERGSHKNPTLLRYHLQSYATYFRKWGLQIA